MGIFESKDNIWAICPNCKGRGRKRNRPSKKARQHYARVLLDNSISKNPTTVPFQSRGSLQPCSKCAARGIVLAQNHQVPAIDKYPNVAIIGGGIGGVAFAIACLHRQIPFTLYERDNSFDTRRQGYGLTLQQATKTIKSLGILTLEESIVSTQHLVHTTAGEVIASWGMRKWLGTDNKLTGKHTNLHIARQSLRLKLYEQLGGESHVQWGHQLMEINQQNQGPAQLNFLVNGLKKCVTADIVVGADGIRSTVRKKIIGEHKTPLQYLGCMVILGICPLSALTSCQSSLLDSATVFQTANGYERMYMMPFSKDTIMWQFSFPIAEKQAQALSNQGAEALKAEACKRADWHSPIPAILTATNACNISGYPVYDRALITPELFQNIGAVTLIGDAAHPMSPFKGQGANQALLDALSLARTITEHYKPATRHKPEAIRTTVLSQYEAEMTQRTAPKVRDSANAAVYLHSEAVLKKVNKPRGSCNDQ